MRILLPSLTLALLILGTGCRRGPDVDVDKVPVGTDVQVTRADGGLVEGKLVERDAAAVKVDVGPVTRSVERDKIADVRIRDVAKPVRVPEAARFREVIVSADTPLKLRLSTSVSSATSSVEDPVEAELAESVMIDGVTVMPSGSSVRGHVTSAESSGKVKGRSSLALRFDSIVVGGERYPLDARFARTAESTRSKDVQKVAIPAAVGAIIGAIIGDRKGAAIGAAAGGGAGAAIVLSTTGPEIVLDRGSVLSLQAGRTVDVRVPIERR